MILSFDEPLFDGFSSKSGLLASWIWRSGWLGWLAGLVGLDLGAEIWDLLVLACFLRGFERSSEMGFTSGAQRGRSVLWPWPLLAGLARTCSKTSPKPCSGS